MTTFGPLEPTPDRVLSNRSGNARITHLAPTLPQPGLEECSSNGCNFRTLVYDCCVPTLPAPIRILATPKFNRRIMIRLRTSAKGRRSAHYWSLPHAVGLKEFGRWLPLKRAVAESMLVQDHADRYDEPQTQA